MASLITLGDLLDRSVAHYEKNWRHFLKVGSVLFLAYIPSVIAKLLPRYLPANTSTLVNLSLNVFQTVAGIVITLATIYYVIRLIQTISVQAGTEARGLTPRELGKKALAFLVLNIVITLALVLLATPPILGVVFFIVDQFTKGSPVLSMVGTFLLFIGGPISIFSILYWGLILRFAPYALVLEDLSIIKTIKRARELAKGRWWSMLALYILPVVLITFITFVFNGLAYFVLRYVAALLTTVVPDPASWAREVIGLFGAVAYEFIQVFSVAIFMPMFVLVEYYLFESLRKTLK